MKQIITVFLILLIAKNSYSGNTDPLLAIIPKPVHTIKGTGFANISAQWKIYIPKIEFNNEAEFLNDFLKKNYGFTLTVLNSIPKGKDIILFQKIFEDSLPMDYYRLSIKQNNISINAGESSGFFYGIQTLIQLLPLDKGKQISIPLLEIEDFPRFKWRGMHLDVCRHFFSKEEIKKYIDYLARYKMNVFHWHLTEDQGWRIEIKSHPELTNIGAWRKGSMVGPYIDQKFDSIMYGGFYTQSEIQEIVLYAEKNHITIVPEIEMPGHCMAALASDPELSCTGGPFEVGKIWGVYDDVFCPKEETFKFLEDVLTEVCDLFPGTYIHVGGDEVPKVRWKNCEHCQRLIKSLNLKDETELQNYFINRIEKFLRSKGKKIIGWDEILQNGLAPNAAIMSWQGTTGGIAAAKQKHFAVMTPGDYCYFDHYQSANRGEPLAFGGYTPLEKVYSYEPIPPELNVEEQKYISGAQGNVWTEYIPDFSQVEYMIFPRMCALAEVVWSQAENKNYDDYIQRLLVHFLYFEKNKINYSKSMFDVKAEIVPEENYNGVKILLSSYFDNTPIHYSIDGSEVTSKSSLYDSSIHIDHSTIFKAGAFENNLLKGRVFEQEINFNKATGKKITLAIQPSVKYNYGGAFTLVNGITGDLPWKGTDWLGFSGDSLVAVIDFGKKENFSKVTLDVLEDTTSWIYLPKSVEVYSSDDGMNFMPLKKISFEEIKLMKRKLILDVGKSNTRYIKIVSENFGIIPEGMPGENNPAWLFVDEIIVE